VSSSLQPIRDAFAAAAEPPPPTVEEAEQARRDADARAIKDCFKKQGRDTAWRLARALKWSADDFEALIAPKRKPRAGASPGGAASAAEAAPPEGGDAASPPSEPDDAAGGEEARWKRPKEPIKPLPDDFPVKPLGKSGAAYHYLDPLGELVSLHFSDHSAMGLRALLGPNIDWLWATWPKWNASTGNQSGFQADRAAESLMHACARRGIFDAVKRLRGTGAWLDEFGRLTLHAGDAVLYDGEWLPPGEHGRHVYPAFETAPRPAESGGDYRALFDELLALLDTWNWREEGGDAELTRFGPNKLASLLLFGWIGGAMFGGALAWRPMVWLTGEAGSGKSSLIKLIAAIIGDLVQIENATEASVRGSLNQSTRPVLLDETENDPKSSKNNRLVDLALVLASGGKAARSSSDHKITEFELRSSALFGSIIIPPMSGANVSRFVVLDLDALPHALGFKIDGVKMAKVGRAMRRRIVDGWGRLDQTMELWSASLAARGHNRRGCDVYGTLFAMLDLMLWDEPADSDTRAALAGMVSIEAIEQRTSGTDGTAAMLQFIGSTAIDAFRGGTKFTIGALIEAAALFPITVDSGIGTPSACAEILRERGIFVGRDERTQEDFRGDPPANWRQGGFRVTLPNQHEGLRLIFAQSRWRTDPGTTGGWAQAMRRLPGVLAENSRKLGGRGWSVPVDVFLQVDREGG